MKADYGAFFLICIIVLMILIFFCLVLAIQGPRLTDRIVAVNMMGTMIIAVIGLLAVYLGESALLDICLLFAAMSFIAVIVLTKIYHGIYNEIHSGSMTGETGGKYEHFHHSDDTGGGSDWNGNSDYGDTGVGRI